MAQSVGLTYKSKIPNLGDDASIEEALKVYHYGVENYTSQPIPNDSIEGNFRQLKIAIDDVATNLANLQSTTGYIRAVSQTSSRNIMTSQSPGSVPPLTIRATTGQSAPLIRFESVSESAVGVISTAGAMYLASTLALNSTTTVLDTALTANISAIGNKGIVVKASSGQTANMQEWQDSGGNVLSRVAGNGNIFAPTITGTTDITSLKMTVTGTQTLAEFRVRNTYASTSNPTALQGSIGDVWFTYV